MAENDAGVENTEVNEEVSEVELEEAKTLGWVPKEEFRGDETRWVDAKTFLEKGRHILPIVQENNKRLMGEVSSLRTSLASQSNALKAANAAIEAIQASQEEDAQEQVAAAKEAIKQELAAASRDGDHQGVADLTVKLTELNSAEKPKVEDKPKDDSRPQIHPGVVAWYDKNPDFVKDRRRVSLAATIAQELRESGDTRVGEPFMDAVAEEVEKVFGPVTRRGAGKVESGNGGTGRREVQSGGAKSYDDLPKEAKDACDRQAKRLVGPNRAHKDMSSWRKSYARQYFAE